MRQRAKLESKHLYITFKFWNLNLLSMMSSNFRASPSPMPVCWTKPVAKNSNYVHVRWSQRSLMLCLSKKELHTTHYWNKFATMVRAAVKLANAAYTCGFFAYYMLQHEWSVLQALTFQVHQVMWIEFNWQHIQKGCILLQGLLLLAVYCLLALLEEQIPSLAPLAYLLQNISIPIAVFISLLSWDARQSWFLHYLLF